MVLIRGEWYCIAWARILRTFRLARMVEVQITKKMPKNTPAHIPSQEVDDLLAESFFATGSTDPGRRSRVVLAVSPGAWPFVQGRTWGINQRIDEAPTDLEPGWRRLSFTTTGLAECRHWVLSMGSGLRAEQPKELVEWLRSEAHSLSSTYKGRP
jgi:predicted DNA-binding transcriptional regulator YafY